MNKTEKRYVAHRKKLLKEAQGLIMNRIAVNRQLKEIKKELGAWDNWLIR